MTTYGVPEDAELADGIGAAIQYAVPDHDAWAGLSELRNMAQPGNGWPGPAAVPWGAPRLRAAAALRKAAAAGHPAAGKLSALADGLEAEAWPPHERHLHPAAAPVAPVPVADQLAAGVPREETVTIAEQKAGAELPPAAPASGG
jgi:hypothetical protein